jgi:hypothetical protein
MEELPLSEAASQPASSAPRPRSTRSETSVTSPTPDSPATPRMAPAVLFQPPAPPPDDAPASRQHGDRPTASGSTRATSDSPADNPPAPVDDTGGSGETPAAETPTPAKRTRAKKATPAKASGTKTAAASKTTASKSTAGKTAAAKSAAAKKTAAKKTTAAVATSAESAESAETTQQDAEATTQPAKTTKTKTTRAKATARKKTATASRTAGEAATLPETLPEPPAVAIPEAPPPRLLDHAAYAPELLALAAVRTLGPAARAWAEQTRATYPGATPDGLARLATQRFLRLSRTSGALATAAGLLAPIAGLTATAWTQANLVLHLAAAYGHDPSHPDRAVELLVLTRVHPDEETARAALATAKQPPRPAERSLATTAGRLAQLVTPLAGRTSGWLVSRLARRVLPGVAAMLAAAASAAETERVAARAIARYRVRAAAAA